MKMGSSRKSDSLKMGPILKILGMYGEQAAVLVILLQ